jgi:hypothetical protein
LQADLQERYLLANIVVQFARNMGPFRVLCIE